jgi:hypothetical protein
VDGVEVLTDVRCCALMALRRLRFRRAQSLMVLAVSGVIIGWLAWAGSPIGQTPTSVVALKPLSLGLSRARFVGVGRIGVWVFPGRHVCLSGPGTGMPSACVRAYDVAGGRGGTPPGAAPLDVVSIVLLSGRIVRADVIGTAALPSQRGEILALTIKAPPSRLTRRS